MNRDMSRRLMMRDYARRSGRMMDRRYEQQRPEVYHNEQQYMPAPQVYSNEYAMGGRAFDSNSRNRYTTRGFDSREPDYNRGDRPSAESDYARRGDYAMYDRRMDGHHIYPFEVAGRFGKMPYYPHGYGFDYAMDGHEPGMYMSEQELKEWDARLLEQIDEKDKAALKKEQVLREASELGIRFDKFTEQEYYVVVLMMYTDFCKTLGTANFDVYLKLAKDWLCDEDSALKYGERLAAYHDHIVMGA